MGTLLASLTVDVRVLKTIKCRVLKKLRNDTRDVIYIYNKTNNHMRHLNNHYGDEEMHQRERERERLEYY